MNRSNKETVGKIAVDLMSQKQENSDPIAQQRAMLSDYEKNFNEAFERGLSQFHGDFYIVIITKKERLLQNVLRNYFIVRESCPTPDYDQSVYRCVKKDSRIDLLWTIPNKQACDSLRHRVADIPKEEIGLQKCIVAFYDGTLMLNCNKLNGELKESAVSGSFNPEDFNEHENHVVIK